jgi:hypothetical protein
MPKIIKRGQIRKPDLYKMTCYRCDTVALFEQTEAIMDRYGTYLRCPVCDAVVSVDSDHVLVVSGEREE